MSSRVWSSNPKFREGQTGDRSAKFNVALVRQTASNLGAHCLASVGAIFVQPLSSMIRASWHSRMRAFGQRLTAAS
jgi:hypothetical protein